MRHPYQCLAWCRTDGPTSKDVLVAGCGSQILARDLETGILLFAWPESQKDEEDENTSSPDIITAAKNGDDRARKRRKIVKPKGNAGSFTKFITSRDKHHLVATTGEEKSVYVFHVDGEGRLELLSERHMLKRPCAIALTPEDEYILVGDKFGDVYALPLLPSETELPNGDNNGTSNTKSTPQFFKPAATDLTVHSKRNLRALQSQMERTAEERKPKEFMEFEHELLLGHVSMLTDIITASVHTTGDNGSGAKATTRNYILTADRDEHIRVSRGRPQAWVIENYCFGHTQFVSKLCVPHQDILISGGGDNHLFVWEWRKGTMLGKLDLQAAISKYWETQPVRMRRSKKDMVQKANDEASILQDSREAEGLEEAGQDPEELEAEDSIEDRVAVSGLWGIANVTGSEHGGGSEHSTSSVFCTCEGIPAIFKFEISALPQQFTEDGTQLQILPLAGNPLSVALCPDRLIVSVDNMHEPASIDTVRKSESDTRLHIFKLASNSTRTKDWSSESGPLEDALNQSQGLDSMGESNDTKSLRELLYGVENLRKRGNEEP